jgi:hypothetical protein
MIFSRETPLIRKKNWVFLRSRLLRTVPGTWWCETQNKDTDSQSSVNYPSVIQANKHSTLCKATGAFSHESSSSDFESACAYTFVGKTSSILDKCMCEQRDRRHLRPRSILQMTHGTVAPTRLRYKCGSTANLDTFFLNGADMAQQLPRGSMQLAAGICGAGFLFAFTQGSSVPARLEDRAIQSADSRENNVRLQKVRELGNSECAFQVL